MSNWAMPSHLGLTNAAFMLVSKKLDLPHCGCRPPPSSEAVVSSTGASVQTQILIRLFMSPSEYVHRM